MKNCHLCLTSDFQWPEYLDNGFVTRRLMVPWPSFMDIYGLETMHALPWECQYTPDVCMLSHLLTYSWSKSPPHLSSPNRKRSFNASSTNSLAKVWIPGGRLCHGNFLQTIFQSIFVFLVQWHQIISWYPLVLQTFAARQNPHHLLYPPSTHMPSWRTAANPPSQRLLARWADGISWYSPHAARLNSSLCTLCASGVRLQPVESRTVSCNGWV